ncbi:unnamed protein product, partial [Owenia fusiformis]
KLDSLVYQALETIRQESNITLSIDVGSGLNVVFNDTNPHISKLLHEQVPMLFTNDSFNYTMEINTESCIPDPSLPSYESTAERNCLLATIGSIFILTLLQPWIGPKKPKEEDSKRASRVPTEI